MSHRVSVPQETGEITITTNEAGATKELAYKVHEGHIEVAAADLPTVLRHVEGAQEVKARAEAK